MAELEDAIRDLGARATLRRLASGTEALKPAAYLTISAAAGIGLADLSEIVFGGAPLVGTVAAAARAAGARGDAPRAAECNELSLYEANRQLQR